MTDEEKLKALDPKNPFTQAIKDWANTPEAERQKFYERNAAAIDRWSGRNRRNGGRRRYRRKEGVAPRYSFLIFPKFPFYGVLFGGRVFNTTQRRCTKIGAFLGIKKAPLF